MYNGVDDGFPYRASGMLHGHLFPRTAGESNSISSPQASTPYKLRSAASYEESVRERGVGSIIELDPAPPKARFWRNGDGSNLRVDAVAGETDLVDDSLL